MVITLGQQYNAGEKPTVMLYAYYIYMLIAMRGHQTKIKQTILSTKYMIKNRFITTVYYTVIVVHRPFIG